VTTNNQPSFEVARLDVDIGVRRVRLSPSGLLAAIERDDKVDLFDIRAGKVIRSTAGAALGGPDDDGKLLILDRTEPSRWRIRDAADARDRGEFAMPEARWTVDTSVTKASGALVGLRARGQQSLMSFGPGFDVRAKRDRTSDGNSVGPTTSTTADGSRIFSVTVHDDSVTVEALAGDDLHSLWSTTLTPPPQPPATDPPPSGGRAPVPPIASEDLQSWGYDPSAMISVSGDGSRVLVVIGYPIGRGLSDPQWLVTLDAASGTAGRTRKSTELGVISGGVIGLTAEPRSSRIALLHVSSFRRGMEDNLSKRFDGISRLDLATGARAETYVPPPASPAFVPSAIAAQPDGGIIVCP
jgi:hypothetical protein